PRAGDARAHRDRGGGPGPARARRARRPVARPCGPHVRSPLRRRERSVTVINVDKDLDACSLTITAEFDAPLERVWELWADPRKLERRWGAPTHAAAFGAPERA